MVDFNAYRFADLFGVYGFELQEIILKQISNLDNDKVLGLSTKETADLRRYIELGEENENLRTGVSRVNSDVYVLKKKLMSGIMDEKYRLEIADCERQMRSYINFNDVSQLKGVCRYTTSQLIEMFGVGAYALLKRSEEYGFYPLPDLAPNGVIRPIRLVDDIEEFSCRTRNALCRNGMATINKVLLLGTDEEEIMKIDGIGEVSKNEIVEFVSDETDNNPLYYEKLIELREKDKSGVFRTDIFDSKREFELFKKECELRRIINVDDEEALRTTQSYTTSQLNSMFGDLYEVLKMYCQRYGFYPLPEVDDRGCMVPLILISETRKIWLHFDALKDVGFDYVHQLLEIDRGELEEKISLMPAYYKNDIHSFVGDVTYRYPEHVARLKEMKKERQKIIEKK